MKTKLLSAVFLGFLLSLPILAQEPPAAPAAAPEEAPAPRIVAPETIYDFGERESTEVVEHNYVIRNEGEVSLEITSVRASCGCTAVKPSQNVIAPGEEATVQARFDLRGRNGMQIKTITVNSNDPKTPALTLQLKGTIVNALRAQPSSLFFGRVEPEASRTRTFDIISGKGPIQIVEYRTTHPGLVVTPVAAEPGADGTMHRFELALDASLPEGNINGSVIVKTDMENQPELTLPVAAFIVAPPSPAPAEEPAPAAAQ